MMFKHLMMAGGLAASLLAGAANAQIIGGEVDIDGSNNDVEFLGGEMSVRGVINGDISGIAGDVMIDAEVFGDIEFAGGDIYIGGTVNGGIEVAGGDVQIAANVVESVEVAGGNVVVEGAVGGSLSGAGGNFELHSAVAGDAEMAGGHVYIAEAAGIGGRVEIIGASIEYLGSANDTVDIEGAEVVISGTFRGDLNILAEEVTLTDSAVVEGLLDVRGPSEPVIAPGATVADFTYTEEWFNFSAKHWDDFDFDFDAPWSIIGAPFEYLGGAFVGSALILGLLISLIAPRSVSNVAGTFRRRPVSSGVLGFIVFALSPVIMIMLTVLLAITLVGALLIPLLWLLYFPVLFLAFVLGGIAVGDLIFNRNHPNKGLGLAMRAVSLLVVLAAIFALGVVEGLGATAGLVVMCIGLGAWMLSFGQRKRRRRRRDDWDDYDEEYEDDYDERPRRRRAPRREAEPEEDVIDASADEVSTDTPKDDNSDR